MPEMEWMKIQLTRKCNLNCKYYSQAEFDRTHDLDIEDLKMNAILPSSIRLVIITGGELLEQRLQLQPGLWKLLGMLPLTFIKMEAGFKR